jgi:hypothetical protein
MAYENITLRKRNFIMVDGYFYMFDEDTDSLIVKTDDGTQAFSYPLDTIIAPPGVVSLEYDGRNFWTLENLAGNDIRIRKWYLDNYVCKLRTTFNMIGDTNDKYESNAFTVEHYHRTFSSSEAKGQSNLNISDTSKMKNGTWLTLGPSTVQEYKGLVEEVEVNTVAPSSVLIHDETIHAYNSGDPIVFSNYIWVFNNWDGVNLTGALYQFDVNQYLSPPRAKDPGGEYADVEACTFYDMSDVYGSDSDAICYVKGTNTLFLDPDDLNTSLGSMVMDNVDEDQARVLAIYDLTIEGSNVYRLQLEATYYGKTYPFADDAYSYQLSTLDPFITSISLSADPAILPADGISPSAITAIVKDQFLLPIEGRPVTFTDDDTTSTEGAYITPPIVNTDAYGVAPTTYIAGNQAKEVRITATAQQTPP